MHGTPGNPGIVLLELSHEYGISMLTQVLIRPCPAFQPCLALTSPFGALAAMHGK